MLMAQQVVGDLVDLALHVFEFRHEHGGGLGAADQLFPPAAFSVRVQLLDGEATDRRHDIAQRRPGGAHILVLDVLQHRLADLLQTRLRAGAKGYDGARIRHVDLVHPLADLGGHGGCGLLKRDQIGLRLGQHHGGDLV